METNALRIILATMAILPSVAVAQQNIINTFEAIKNCDKAEIEESHFLQRDPVTGVKTAQSDVYDFTLPKSKKSLITNLVRAFNDDSKLAYSLSSGDESTLDRDLALAVGDGTSNNVLLTTSDGRYIYACFLAPKDEDPDGNCRYAYGLSYDADEEDDGEIEGRFVITYASTMKHRQESSRVISVKDLTGAEAWGNDTNSATAQEPWIRVFMRYVTSLGYSNEHTRPTNAGYIYEVTSNIGKYKDVSEQDKETAKGILVALFNDKANSSPVVRQILKGALENIK